MLSIHRMLFLIFIWLYQSADGQSCIYQGCTCYGNSTSCNYLSLKNIPPLVATGSVTELSFDWNSITSIPAASLPPNVQYLSIMSNPLSSIDDAAFDGSSTTLQSFTLSGAVFNTFPKSFGNLKALVSIYFYNTTVSDWNEDVMKHLGSTMKSLMLEACNFTFWPVWLKYFTHLLQLSFSDNLISSIPEGGLDAMADTLTTLNIQNNSLTSVPKAFSKLTALQTLYLPQNKITDVTWLPPNSKLTTLFLENNKIYDVDQLSKALYPYATTLQQLGIDSNSLTLIPNISFFQNLDFMDFSHNQISSPSSGELPSVFTGVSFSFNNLRSIPTIVMSLKQLKNIGIGYNYLTQIRDFEFPPWTISADFGNNLITELTDNSFPVNCSLQILELNNNPFYRMSSQAFQNVPQLQYLNLESTKLSRLPLGLLSGQGLMVVDFQGCDRLVCTCQEKELRDWIRAKTMYAINGNCGRTSIYEFYSNLVNDCPA